MRRGVHRDHTSTIGKAVLAASAILVLVGAGVAMADPAPPISILPADPSPSASPSPTPSAPSTSGFGKDGTVALALGDGGDARARALVRQPDGDLVVAGYARDHGRFVLALARFTADGSRDTGFGHNGSVLTPIGSGRGAQGNAAVVQPDGRIVVAGSASDDGQQKFALARYNPDGSLDTSFGTNGLVLTAVGGENTTSQAVANALLLQPDGGLIAVGTATVTVMVGPSESEQSVIALARYSSTGVLDESFGKNGLVATAVGQSSSIAGADAAMLQSDGKIVVAGSAFEQSNNYSPGTYLAVLRFTPTGAADTSFGSAASSGGSGGAAQQSGVYIGHLGTAGGTSSAWSLAAGPNGDIVAAGYGQDHGRYKFVAVQLTSAGSVDTSFGTNGSVLTEVGDGGSASANGLVAAPDGELVAAGTALDGGRHKVGLLRWTGTGNLDNTFGSNGTALTSFGSSAGATALLIEPDGSVITAGWGMHDARYEFLLTRTVAPVGGPKLDTGKLLTSLPGVLRPAR